MKQLYEICKVGHCLKPSELTVLYEALKKKQFAQCLVEIDRVIVKTERTLKKIQGCALLETF